MSLSYLRSTLFCLGYDLPLLGWDDWKLSIIYFTYFLRESYGKFFKNFKNRSDF